VSLPRSVSLAVLIVVSTTWAALLVFVGLWLTLDGPQGFPIPPVVRQLLGVAGVAGGVFVFMFLVADRVFPRVAFRLLSWKYEMCTFLVAALSLFAAGVVVALRGCMS